MLLVKLFLCIFALEGAVLGKYPGLGPPPFDVFRHIVIKAGLFRLSAPSGWDRLMRGEHPLAVEQLYKDFEVILLRSDGRDEEQDLLADLAKGYHTTHEIAQAVAQMLTSCGIPCKVQRLWRRGRGNVKSATSATIFRSP